MFVITIRRIHFNEHHWPYLNFLIKDIFQWKSTLFGDTVLPRKYHEKIFLLSLCNLVLNAQDTFNNYITKSEFIWRGNEVKSFSTLNILLRRLVSRYIFENCLILKSDAIALSNSPHRCPWRILKAVFVEENFELLITYLRYFGYIDVGDGCWRPNVLVTSLRCWWPIQDVGDRFDTLRKSPT